MNDIEKNISVLKKIKTKMVYLHLPSEEIDVFQRAITLMETIKGLGEVMPTEKHKYINEVYRTVNKSLGDYERTNIEKGYNQALQDVKLWLAGRVDKERSE